MTKHAVSYGTGSEHKMADAKVKRRGVLQYVHTYTYVVPLRLALVHEPPIEMLDTKHGGHFVKQRAATQY
jgi:hypothetical protein